MKQSMPTALILALAMLGAAALTARAGSLPEDSAAHARETVTHVCEACHGRRGNSTDPHIPSLAGQGSPYLEKQLAAFQAQRRLGVMSGIAMDLSAADMQDAAAYFSQQRPHPNPDRSANPAVLARGEAIYADGIATKNVPACASCHALDGAGLPPEFPRLAGQHADYLAAQLRAFRSDSRISNPNAMMREVSARLSDDEINAVAEYIDDMH